MRALLRTLLNLLLALALFALFGLLLLVGYGVVVSGAWEYAGPADVDEEGGDWLWLDDARPIYYRQSGEARTASVVLIHGLGVEGSVTWEALAPHLSRAGLRVVVVDLEGLGRSHRAATPEYTLRRQAQVVAAVIERLGLGSSAVAGHGWGAAVAVQLAQDRPELVEHLVLLAPRWDGPAAEPWARAAGVPYLGRAAAWGLASGGPFWAPAVRRGFGDRKAADAYLDAARPLTHIEGSVEALLALALSPPEGLQPPDPAASAVPTLVLVGDGDPYVSVEEATLLAQSISGASLAVQPGAGHYAHVERATAVSRLMIEFVLRD